MRELIFKVAGNDRTQTNGIIKKKRGGNEIFKWLKMTGPNPYG